MTKGKAGAGALMGAAGLWALLHLWRETAGARWDSIVEMNRRHYAELEAKSSEPLHPVRMGDLILVERTPGDDREYAELYYAPSGPLENVWLAGGDALGRIKTPWFHGACAVGMILFAAYVGWREPRDSAA